MQKSKKKKYCTRKTALQVSAKNNFAILEPARAIAIEKRGVLAVFTKKINVSIDTIHDF